MATNKPLDVPLDARRLAKPRSAVLSRAHDLASIAFSGDQLLLSWPLI